MLIYERLDGDKWVFEGYLNSEGGPLSYIAQGDRDSLRRSGVSAVMVNSDGTRRLRYQTMGELETHRRESEEISQKVASAYWVVHNRCGGRGHIRRGLSSKTLCGTDCSDWGVITEYIPRRVVSVCSRCDYVYYKKVERVKP